MQQPKKIHQLHLGMNAHISVDAESRLAHIVMTTSVNAHDATQAHAFLHGEERVVSAD